MGEKGRALIHVRCYYCHDLSGDRQPRLKYAVSHSFNLKPKFTLLSPETTMVEHKQFGLQVLYILRIFIWQNLASFFGKKFYLFMCFALEFRLCYLAFSVWNLSPGFPLGSAISYLFLPQHTSLMLTDKLIQGYQSICPFYMSSPSLELEEEETAA